MNDRASIHAAATSPVDTASNAAFLQGTLGSSTRAFRDEALLSPLISTARNGLRGQAAVRSPGALRLHPAFNELNLADWLIHSESQGRSQPIHEPILITNQGILLTGFAEWHAAVCARQAAIDCTEFALNDDAALQLILTLHRPRASWNDFTRTELALEQEPYFQSKALANQIAGGKYKGLAGYCVGRRDAEGFENLECRRSLKPETTFINK
jgi:hypothetical protein